MAEIIKRLKDEDLLIDKASTDYVVTADNWKDAMTAIKETVNNNADLQSLTVDTPVSIPIGERGSDSRYSWIPIPPSGYYCVIPHSAHGKTGYFQVRFYNSLGAEVQCNYKIDTANEETAIISRVNTAITVIFR